MGCTQSSTSCTANDQCGTGNVCRAGECVLDDTATTRDGGVVMHSSSGASSSGGGSSTSGQGGNDGGANAPDSGAMMGCAGADDGVLTAAELPLALGVESRFISTNADGGVAVNLAGTSTSDGGTLWDLSMALPGDRPTSVSAQALTGFWFGEFFPTGDYAAPLDGAGDNFGIFHRTAEQLVLVGTASREPDTTKLTYDPPVVVLRFPLAVGDHFTSETSTSGTLSGNSFYTSTDSYVVDVDAHGTVRTPAGDFPALRVRVQQTISIPYVLYPFHLDYTYVRYSFMTACYSQVAQVVSQEGETNLLFTNASEVRRLGLPQ